MFDDVQMFDKHGRMFVAVAYQNGELVDHIYNAGTAFCMSQEGYEVIAIADDETWSQSEIQRICDHNLELYTDCFGG